MLAGQTYVFSVSVYLPTGTTAAPYLQILDRLSNETTEPHQFNTTWGTPASLSLLNTWQQITVSATLRTPPATPPGIFLTEAFVRLVYPETSGNVSKAIWIDGAMLEVPSGPNYAQTNPPPSSTTQYFDNATRAAIGGSELQTLVLQADRIKTTTVALYNNGVIEGRARTVAGFQTRVADVAPDIVFVMYSTNDLYRWQSLPPGTNPPVTTLATWQNAVTSLSTVTSDVPYPVNGTAHGLLYQLLSLPKVPQIVWCGELMTTWTWADTSLFVTNPGNPNTWPGPLTYNGYRDQLAADMDDVARQECAKVGVPFIPIRSFMDPQLCIPAFGSKDGFNYQGNKHPSPAGMRFLAAHIARALEQGR